MQTISWISIAWCKKTINEILRAFYTQILNTERKSLLKKYSDVATIIKSIFYPIFSSFQRPRAQAQLMKHEFSPEK